MDDFAYTKSYREGKVKVIHPDLDPKLMKGGIRESRDSSEHPSSRPVAIIFDVTGSMGTVPEKLQGKLTKLMDIIVDKAKMKDPQVLVGAVGDSYADQFPFQVGQFESDNRFDEQLRNIILEGGGGGQMMESYGLAYWFAANHTTTDCWEKRRQKGYLFTMGDEAFWPVLKRSELKGVFGTEVDSDKPVAALVKEVLKQWEVFHLFSMDGGYPDRDDIKLGWIKLLGERFVKVQDSGLVCEIIAGIVYGLEAVKDAEAVLKDMGIKGPNRDSVSAAIKPVIDRFVRF